jgi:hypothetical protein
MFRIRCKREFGFQGSIFSLLLESYRRVGSATPPKLRFYVSKTGFSLEGSALSASFFSIEFHGSKVLQDSVVLLRFGCLKSTLFSVSRTAWKHLIASQSPISSEKSNVCTSATNSLEAFDCFTKSNLHFGKYAALGFTDIL